MSFNLYSSALGQGTKYHVEKYRALKSEQQKGMIPEAATFEIFLKIVSQNVDYMLHTTDNCHEILKLDES